MMRLLVASLLALAALCAPAAAQSCPPWGSVKTLTVGQWQACFDAKQNALGYVPVNKAGDTMIGPLTMAASSTVTAGINIQPGVAPTFPNNGDFWTTSVGVFAQINGTTVGPFGSSGPGSLAATAPVAVNFVGALATFSLNIDSRFAVVSNNLALASQAAATLLGNCTVSSAEPQPCTIGATLAFSGTALQTVAHTGDMTTAANSFVTTVVKVNGVAYPTGPSTNTVPVVTGSNVVTYQTVPNAALANSAITIAGTSTALGGSITASAILDSIGSTRGSILERGASGWAAITPGTSGLPLVSGGAGADPSYAALANAALVNSSITIGSTSMSLGSTTGTIAGTVAFSGTLNASGTFQIGGTAVALPISLANGGTAANLTASNGGIVYSTSSAFAVLAGTVTSGQCLLSGSSAAPTWGACAGGAAVSTVSNADGTLTISPTTGAVVASIALGHANTWSAAQTFSSGINTSSFQLGGNTMTFPAAAATIPRVVASGTAALGTSAITSASCATVVTATATGTATTDVVDASFNGDPSAVTGYAPVTTGMLTILSYPTTNTVNFKVCNTTGSSITPGAITLNWSVRR
jgi:hypothetical protein